MSWEYGLSEGGRLFAGLKFLPEFEFVNGTWVPYEGILEPWLDSRPITAAEAASLTSGIMPE